MVLPEVNQQLQDKMNEWIKVSNELVQRNTSFYEYEMDHCRRIIEDMKYINSLSKDIIQIYEKADWSNIKENPYSFISFFNHEIEKDAKNIALAIDRIETIKNTLGMKSIKRIVE